MLDINILKDNNKPQVTVRLNSEIISAIEDLQNQIKQVVAETGGTFQTQQLNRSTCINYLLNLALKQENAEVLSVEDRSFTVKELLKVVYDWQNTSIFKKIPPMELMAIVLESLKEYFRDKVINCLENLEDESNEQALNKLLEEFNVADNEHSMKKYGDILYSKDNNIPKEGTVIDFLIKNSYLLATINEIMTDIISENNYGFEDIDTTDLLDYLLNKPQLNGLRSLKAINRYDYALLTKELLDISDKFLDIIHFWGSVPNEFFNQPTCLDKINILFNYLLLCYEGSGMQFELYLEDLEDLGDAVLD